MFKTKKNKSKKCKSKKCKSNKLERLQITGNMDPTAEYKNKIIFNTYGNGVGHWIYFSRTGEEFNSYNLEHQKPRTNLVIFLSSSFSVW